MAENLIWSSMVCLFFHHFSVYKKISLQKGASKYKGLFAVNDSFEFRFSDNEIKKKYFSHTFYIFFLGKTLEPDKFWRINTKFDDNLLNYKAVK